MSKMRKHVIVALVCVNVVLMASLVLLATAPTAQAGIIGARTDYLVVTGRVSKSSQAVYVIDLAREAMAAWKFDVTTKKMQFIGTRSLRDEF